MARRGVAIAAVVAGGLVAGLMAGCGRAAPRAGGGAASPTSASASGAAASGAATSGASGGTTRSGARRRRPGGTDGAGGAAGAPIGATLTVRGGANRLAVTVTRVLDPLRATGSASVPGTRAVGVMVTIRNRGGGTYDSTASGDLSVVSTAGPAAPLFIRRGACQTPLTDFESLVGGGQVRSGCVGFSVPRGARIVAVRFSPHARAAGSVAWR